LAKEEGYRENIFPQLSIRMIQLSNISVSFGETILFKDITWNIGLSERIALVGPNGAGKTTLFKIALGLMAPTAGGVASAKKMRTGYLPQQEVVFKGRTVLEEASSVFADRHAMRDEAEELSHLMAAMSQDDPELPAVIGRYGELHHLFEGQDGYQLESRTKSVLQGLGFSEDDFSRPVETFSGGWQMRLALAKLLLQEPSYLFLDEPTNHLDIESMEYLESFLKSFKGTAVMISHDRYFIDRTVKKIFELEHGRLDIYHTNYSGYLTEKEKRRELLIKQQIEQDKEIEHLKEFVCRWKGNYIKRAMVTSREKMIAKLQQQRVDLPSTVKGFRLNLPQPPYCGRNMVTLKDVSKHYNSKQVLNNVDLLVENGHKLGLVGLNGAGKSTLLKLLARVEDPTSGEIVDSPQARLAYFAQHTAEMLDDKKTVYQQVEDVIPLETPGRVRTILGSFLFPGDDVYKKVSVLSGGEKARLALCCTLLLPANLLILDEPTNHLDLKGKEILEQALKEYRGTVVLVTHDRYLLDQVVDTVVEVADRRISLFPGNYTDYLEKKESLLTQSAMANPQPVKEKIPAGKLPSDKPLWEENKKQKAREAAEQRKNTRMVAELEERIHLLEKKQKVLESDRGGLADPIVYKDGLKMKEKMNEFDKNRKELKYLYDRWEHYHEEKV
jgi:ATP-binding cassette subfamily F protein 3